jgi:hypothetical protein
LISIQFPRETSNAVDNGNHIDPTLASGAYDLHSNGDEHKNKERMAVFLAMVTSN